MDISVKAQNNLNFKSKQMKSDSNSDAKNPLLIKNSVENQSDFAGSHKDNLIPIPSSKFQANKDNWQINDDESIVTGLHDNLSKCPCSRGRYQPVYRTVKQKLFNVIAALSMVLGIFVLISSGLCTASTILDCYGESTCSRQKGPTATQIIILGYSSGLVQIVTAGLSIALRKQPEGYVALILSLLASGSLVLSTLITWSIAGRDTWPFMYFFGLFLVLMSADSALCFLGIIFLIIFLFISKNPDTDDE